MPQFNWGVPVLLVRVVMPEFYWCVWCVVALLVRVVIPEFCWCVVALLVRVDARVILVFDVS